MPVGRSAVLSEDQALCGISGKKEMIRQFLFSVESLEINQATLMCCLFILFHDWVFLLVSDVLFVTLQRLLLERSYRLYELVQVL